MQAVTLQRFLQPSGELEHTVYNLSVRSSAADAFALSPRLLSSQWPILL